MASQHPPASASHPLAKRADKTTATLRSTLVSRNVTVDGHRTSVRLEPEMWNGVHEITRRERATIHDICTRVAELKDDSTSLTAAIRVYIMSYYRNAATDDGHAKAGHGPLHNGAKPGNLAQAISAQASNLQTLQRLSMDDNMIGGQVKPQLRGW